ncbi:MAG: restriction endonuclease subunit S [Coprococcus eutactus]
MTKLNELIEKYCPNGVEYKELRDLACYANKKIDSAELDKNTYVSVENLLKNKQGKTYANSLPTSAKVVKFEIGDILIGNIRPYLKKIWLSDCIGGTNGDVLVVQIKNQAEIIPEFLYYVLSSDHFFAYDVQNSHGAKMPRGNKDAVMKYRFPVPPLGVQREIVHILDSFTLLTAELTAELTARKKQYEYYRNKSLTFMNNMRCAPLKELAIIERGTRVVKSQLEHNGEYPVYQNALAPMGYYDKFNRLENNTYMICAGAAGQIGYSNRKFWAADDCYTFICSKELDNRYLFHVLKNNQNLIDSKIRKASIPRISKSDIESIKIPIPDIDIQRKLVNVLDNFDSICSDLKIGLPAEIEARQKQYEYYRDVLLTFAEMEKTILTDRQTDRQSIIKLLQYVFGYAKVKLEDVCNSISSGNARTKENEGKYPVYGSTGVIARADNARYNKDNILVARVGANAGYINIATGKYDVSDNTLIVDVKEEYCMKYIYYVLVNSKLNQYAKGGGQPLITAGQIKKIEIIIPDYSEQIRISEILDRFQKICMDIEKGLSAEIEKRQKQYEYYRDKLLSFKEL